MLEKNASCFYCNVKISFFEYLLAPNEMTSNINVSYISLASTTYGLRHVILNFMIIYLSKYEYNTILLLSTNKNL